MRHTTLEACSDLPRGTALESEKYFNLKKVVGWRESVPCCPPFFGYDASLVSGNTRAPK